MDKKEIEVILKNSYKGKEILKYIYKLEEQVSNNKEKFLDLKVEQRAKKALFDFEQLFVFYENEVGCSKEEENDFITNIHYIKYLIKDYFKLLEQMKSGELSDGYHTFNELYYHRAVLFSVICNQNKELAWKSKQHSDGTMFDNMFIVGIKTPKGQYSYHYDFDLWDMFKVKELEYAPEWDGHLSKDVDRLRSIDDNPPLKFEELKIAEPIWENEKLGWVFIKYIIKSTKELCCIDVDGKVYTLKYDYGRFYRKRVEKCV